VTDAEVYQIEPSVRVVITFTAAKVLLQSLQSLIPQMENTRKTT